MLLTLPWCLSIIGGRVNLDPISAAAMYKKPAGAPKGWTKLSPPNNWDMRHTGIGITPSVQTSAYIMLATAFTYLIIQIPAFVYYHDTTSDLAKEEKPWALVGLLVALASFSAYLWYQWKISGSDEVKNDRIAEITVKR